MIPQSEFRNPKYQDYIRFAREALGLPRSALIDLYPLKGRGSDRTFYRLRWNPEDSAILIHYDPERLENTFYADIAKFLHEITIPVPQVIGHDRAACLILVEDLGDTDLCSLRDASWEMRRTLYQRTLLIGHKLHAFPEKDFPRDRVRLMGGFGSNLYRWEQDYFKDHFVRGICRIELDPEFERELEAEFSALTRHLSATTRCLVHRDLQSQNVMIHNGEPFLIDFQGMRFGSAFYDLASLLCDPYVHLSDRERQELLSYSYDMGSWNLNWVTFQETFWQASAQRLMQTLGAYGFLGLKKGLKAYLEHIPAGLQNLGRAASQVSMLRRLSELSLKCQQAIDQEGGRT